MTHEQIIGSNIKQAREQLRLSQEQLGRLVGVTNETICRYEAGTANMPTSRLAALAASLYCTMADLCSPDWVPTPVHPTFEEKAHG